MRKAAQAEVDEQKRDRILKDADLVEVIVAPRRSVIVSAVIDFQMVDGLRQPVFGPKTLWPGRNGQHRCGRNSAPRRARLCAGSGTAHPRRGDRQPGQNGAGAGHRRRSMNTRPTDPYAGLRASRARATAALRQPASPKRSAAPEDRSYEHLHGATLRCWTERQPITPHPPTQEEAGPQLCREDGGRLLPRSLVGSLATW